MYTTLGPLLEQYFNNSILKWKAELAGGGGRRELRYTEQEMTENLSVLLRWKQILSLKHVFRFEQYTNPVFRTFLPTTSRINFDPTTSNWLIWVYVLWEYDNDSMSSCVWT